MAWEVTVDDVRNVLENNGKTRNNFESDQAWDEFVDECHSDINLDEVERDVLHGETMDEQIDYANLSIYEQLVIAGKI